MDDYKRKAVAELQSKLNKMRLAKVSVAEHKLEDFKRKHGQNAEAEHKFADMLSDYGNTVKAVDAQLATEREKQMELIEQSVRERKQERLKEIESKRREREVKLNDETVGANQQLGKEYEQLESLLKPIKDEEQRMSIVMSKEPSFIKYYDVPTSTDSAYII